LGLDRILGVGEGQHLVVRSEVADKRVANESVVFDNDDTLIFSASEHEGQGIPSITFSKKNIDRLPGFAGLRVSG
jgi:hypothetical protein